MEVHAVAAPVAVAILAEIPAAAVVVVDVAAVGINPYKLNPQNFEFLGLKLISDAAEDRVPYRGCHPLPTRHKDQTLHVAT